MTDPISLAARMANVARDLRNLGAVRRLNADDYSDELDRSYLRGQSDGCYEASKLIREALVAYLQDDAKAGQP